VAGVDLDGHKTAKRALRKIKGVGAPMASAIVNNLNLHNLKAGKLTDEQVRKIEAILENPVKAGFPAWTVNRAKDYETGEDKHLSGADLIIYKRVDVNRLQKIRSYRGIRHAGGLKCRGQRTRSTGRGNATIGVTRRGAKQ